MGCYHLPAHFLRNMNVTITFWPSACRSNDALIVQNLPGDFSQLNLPGDFSHHTPCWNKIFHSEAQLCLSAVTSMQFFAKVEHSLAFIGLLKDCSGKLVCFCTSTSWEGRAAGNGVAQTRNTRAGCFPSFSELC